MINITLDTAKLFVSLSDQISSKGKLSHALYDNAEFYEDHDSTYDLCEAAINIAKTASAYSIAQPISSISLKPNQVATFHMLCNYHSGE